MARTVGLVAGPGFVGVNTVIRLGRPIPDCVESHTETTHQGLEAAFRRQAIEMVRIRPSGIPEETPGVFPVSIVGILEVGRQRLVLSRRVGKAFSQDEKSASGPIFHETGKSCESPERRGAFPKPVRPNRPLSRLFRAFGRVLANNLLMLLW